MALPFYIKKYLKTKEELMETQTFHHAKRKEKKTHTHTHTHSNLIFKKNPLKRNQNPSRYDYYNSYNN